MFLLGVSSPTKLQTILTTALGQEPSYPEVGATSGEVFPAGYRHDRHEVLVGSHTDFERAVEGLSHWAAHEGAGIRIFPNDQSVTVGATIVAVVSIGFATMVAPCRVVSVVSEPDKFGFAYGTLPGHPERGEEAFTVERRGEGTFFSVRAFSKPADVLVRLSGPFGRVAQQIATRRYIAAMRRYLG
jgi:uncharacterized protein (UPF0548 family)